MATKNKQKCIYCCKRKKETSDHVPPKSFFPKPKPSDLITVPSCLSCNQHAGKDEEFFLATILFSDAGVSKAGKQLWDEKIDRMYQKNAGLRRKIAKALIHVDMVTPAGLYLGRRMAIKLDERRVEKVIDKTIRGLYYFEYKESLPPAIKILSLLLGKEEELEVIKKHGGQLKHGSRRWNGVFKYEYNRIEDSREDSMWLLHFYESVTIWAITGN